MQLALSTWECQTCHKVNQQEAQFMELQPLGDRLIVEVLEEEETTISGIGPGARNDKGDRIPMDVAEGDEVIFSKYGGTEIKLGTDEVLILRESDVLAKAAGTREPAGATA
jgi:chaperonin GroES